MRGWLIYSSSSALLNETYIEWFIREAKKQEIDLKLIHREHLTIGFDQGNYRLEVHGKTVLPPDFAIIRIIEPTLQFFLEACQIPTFNSFSISQIGNHKSFTHIELSKLNIPMVKTYFYNQSTMPEQPPLPYPFIVKEATGRSGKEVFFVKNEEMWKKSALSLQNRDLIIQEANVKLGKDVRVFVIGKEIVSAVLRNNKNDFRANYKLGGDAIPYTLNSSNKKMVQKIINHFDFGLVGIDFLVGKKDELLFNEIEDVVGSRILSEVSDINLLEKYITYIKNIVMKR